MSNAAEKLLFDAVAKGDVAQASAALVQGAGVDSIHPQFYETPLVMAARTRQEDMGLWLLEQGAKAGYITMQRHCALEYASKHSPRLSLALLDAGANPNFRNADRVNVPLVNAVKAGFDDVVEKLLENHAKVNVADNARVTPLVAASLWGSRASFDRLIQAGANPQQVDSLGECELEKPIKLAYRDLTDEQRTNSALMLLSVGAAMPENSRKGSLTYLVDTYRKALSPMMLHIIAAPQPDDEALANADVKSLFSAPSLLDNPATWRRMPELQQALQQKGQMLERADLQAHQAPDGGNYLEFAVRCVGFSYWQEATKDTDLSLKPADLLGDENKASRILDTLATTKDLQGLADASFWQNDRQMLRNVVRSLPPERRADVPLHSLLADMQLQPEQGRGR